MTQIVKDTLVNALRAEGYDFVTACEHVTRWLNDFHASKMGQTTIQIGKSTYQITKRNGGF